MNFLKIIKLFLDNLLKLKLYLNILVYKWQIIIIYFNKIIDKA
jgi:hypothetical protein